MRSLDIMKKMHDDIICIDSSVVLFDANYFFDESTLIFEDDDNYDYKITFLNCSQIEFQTVPDDREKPLKEYFWNEIHYFIQDFAVMDVIVEGYLLLKVYLCMPPMNVTIICKDIMIEHIEKMERKISRKM